MPTDPWATANPFWADQFARRMPLLPTFPLLRDPETSFAQEAARARRIFGRLRIPDVIGSPCMAEAVGEWFFAIVEALLGSYDVETNRRLIQEVFLLVPKKNGKSSLAAALMLTALIMNRRPEAEFLLVAPTKEIANIAFRQARGTIKLDETLSKLFHVQNHTRTITRIVDGSTMQIKAADTDTITGSKQIGTLIDETHVFAKRANAADVFVEIRGALAARPDGFVFQITTQSKDPPAGVFRTELNKARAVRDGSLVLPLLPVLYELPGELRTTDCWKRREYWPRLNPNLGRSVDEEFLARELMTAETGGVEQLTLFASQHFNVEIGVGLTSDHWPGARHWEKNGDPTLTLAAVLDRADLVTIGIDGGGLDDLLAIAVIGRVREDRDGKPADRWLVWVHAWAHRSVLDLRKQDAPKLLDLEAAGDLTLVDDLAEAYADLAEIVSGAYETGTLAKIGLDPAGVKLIVDEIRRALGLTDDGGQDDEDRLIEGVTQGFRLQGTIKSVESKLDSFLITHCAQPLMAWSVGNARVKVSGNAILVTKQASGTGKIDPLMAIFDAADRMLAAKAEVSVYTADRGLLVFG